MVFPARPFEELTPEDYAGIGLMCGLEVHQQLLTRTKLFCRCPAGRYSSAYDAEILRHMRPTLSELGEYDGTALMEKKTRKNIYYRIHRDTVCTYEFDDTPPFVLDDEALDIALRISLLLRLNIVGEVHVARKQYLDGSIPTGFQRTAIIGVGGWIPFGERRIGITQLSLEEDSCREVSDVGHDRVLLTDRLGMPLVETVTDPDMRTPQECAAVCQIIRKLCRSTGRVRRGYGAARQDVNVSVRGGTRIEIKGVPQIGRIPRLIYNEARRQCALLDIRAQLHDRGITPETFRHSVHDVTRVVAKSAYGPLRAALADGWRVKCVRLNGFAGLLNTVTQEHTTFAKEFSDRVRVIACLTRLPNIVHSDSATESLAARDWKELQRKTGASEADALVLVWGDERDTATACEEITIRAREATLGVPSDTRQALPDGTTGFERVLPGAERMYPDTDLPPLEITPPRLDRLQADLPPPVWERAARLAALGIPGDTRAALELSPRLPLFERLVDELQADPTLAAVVLARQLTALRRAGYAVAHLSDDLLYAVLAAVVDGRLAREGLPLVLAHLLRHDCCTADPAASVAHALVQLGIAPLDDTGLDAEVAAALAAADASRFPTAAKLQRHVMGTLMRRLAGRVPGGRVAERLGQVLARGRAGDIPVRVHS
jgi:glutamyl-tRNA(Gln) amidotransferase subunit E